MKLAHFPILTNCSTCDTKTGCNTTSNISHTLRLRVHISWIKNMKVSKTFE